MWFGFMLMLVPGMQVCKFVYGSYQERVLIKVVVYRNTMPFAAMRGPVVAKLAVAVARDFKFTLKVVDPPANKRGSLRRKIGLKNFDFIQCLPRYKDRDLSGRRKAESQSGKLKAEGKKLQGAQLSIGHHHQSFPLSAKKAISIMYTQ